jgi:hypothetical protein
MGMKYFPQIRCRLSVALKSWGETCGERALKSEVEARDALLSFLLSRKYVKDGLFLCQVLLLYIFLVSYRNADFIWLATLFSFVYVVLYFLPKVYELFLKALQYFLCLLGRTFFNIYPAICLIYRRNSLPFVGFVICVAATALEFKNSY